MAKKKAKTVKKKVVKRKTAKKKLGRQQHFNGMEPPKVEEIEAPAEKVRSLERDRKEFAESEKVAREDLIGLMKKHKLTYYKYDGLEVRLKSSSEKITVTKTKKEKKK